MSTAPVVRPETYARSGIDPAMVDTPEGEAAVREFQDLIRTSGEALADMRRSNGLDRAPTSAAPMLTAVAPAPAAPSAPKREVTVLSTDGEAPKTPTCTCRDIWIVALIALAIYFAVNGVNNS